MTFANHVISKFVFFLLFSYIYVCGHVISALYCIYCIECVVACICVYVYIYKWSYLHCFACTCAETYIYLSGNFKKYNKYRKNLPGNIIIVFSSRSQYFDLSFIHLYKSFMKFVYVLPKHQ